MNPRSHGRPVPARRAESRGKQGYTKRWSRPVSRVLYVLRRDSHSSRPGVAAWLQQPTREQRGPRYRSPIWSCSEWGLPCRTALAPYAVRSYRTLSPLPVPLRAIGGLLSVALAVSSRCPGVTWHSALRSPDFPRCACARRDCPADSTSEFTGTGGRERGACKSRPNGFGSRPGLETCGRCSRPSGRRFSGRFVARSQGASGCTSGAASRNVSSSLQAR